MGASCDSCGGDRFGFREHKDDTRGTSRTEKGHSTPLINMDKAPPPIGQQPQTVIEEDGPPRVLLLELLDEKSLELLTHTPTMGKKTINTYSNATLPIDDPYNDMYMNIRIVDETSNEIMRSKPSVRRITTDERNITPTIDESQRLTRLMQCKSEQDLQDYINRRMFDDLSSNGSSTESVLSDDELKEMEIAKLERDHDSAQRKDLNKKAQMFRQGTSTEWNEDEMNKLGRDMSTMLLALARNASDAEIKELSTPIVSKHDSENLLMKGRDTSDAIRSIHGEDRNMAVWNGAGLGLDLHVPSKVGSHLFREESGDLWSDNAIDDEIEQMEAQLYTLAKESIKIHDHNGDNGDFIKKGHDDDSDSDSYGETSSNIIQRESKMDDTLHFNELKNFDTDIFDIDLQSSVTIIF